jgi:hypothetical protein
MGNAIGFTLVGPAGITHDELSLTARATAPTGTAVLVLAC